MRGPDASVDVVGIVVCEDEFLANTIPPGASVTFVEAVREQMAIAHQERTLTPLLPYLRGEAMPRETLVDAAVLVDEFGFTRRHWIRQATLGRVPGTRQPFGRR